MIVLQSNCLRWSCHSIFNDEDELQRMPTFTPTIDDAWPKYRELILDYVYGESELDYSRLWNGARFVIDRMNFRKQMGMSKDIARKELQHIPPFYGQEGVKKRLKDFFDDFADETVRILCVTIEYNNDKMWQKYAGEYSGCVLGFRHIPESDTPLLAAEPIIYTDETPVVMNGLDFLLYGPTSGLTSKTKKAVIYTKTQQWAYENEWRVVIKREHEKGNQYGDYPFLYNELESVTLGSAISAANANKIIELVTTKYQKCNIYKLILNNGRIERAPYDEKMCAV